MKAIKSLVVAAVAALGVAGVADVQAARGGAAHGGSGGGSHAGTWHGGGGHWNGGHYGGRHYGGHWRGGYYGWYWGAPLLWSAWYWGWPYYYGSYPRTVIYEGYPASYPEYPAYPEGAIDPAPDVTPGPGAPTQGPAYMNYCESAKAYYPKVTSCPEGWKFIPPR